MESSPANEHVTLVEVLKLTRPFEAFAHAVRAAARRLETEGVESLVTLQFYATPGSTEVGAILTFADRERVMKHIEMIRGWEEFERFFHREAHRRASVRQTERTRRSMGAAIRCRKQDIRGARGRVRALISADMRMMSLSFVL